MKKINEVSKGTNYTAVTVGKMNELNEHVLTLAPGVEIQGKVFAGQALNATGSDISFQVFAPGKESGFLHAHITHEELYIFVAGSGEFQVDGRVFPVSEGSVVRVAPDGKRSVRNNGVEPLVMICVQFKANVFTDEDAADADILHDTVKW